MVKVAVIGVGNMGKNHARVYSEMSDVELVGVADKDAKIGGDIAKKFSTKLYADYRQLIGKVDAVNIVVPTKLHFQVAKDFLENGIDVLVEKPITSTLKDADELIKIAEKNKRVLQVGHIERFNPAVMQLKDYVKSDEIISMESRRIGPMGDRITDAGVILDLMIHDIDIMLNLVKSDVRSVHAYSKKLGGQYEDFASAIIRFENGAIGTITASRITQKRERSLCITEKDRYIVVDYMNKILEIHKQAKYENAGSGRDVAFVYSDLLEKPYLIQTEPLKLELSSFINCVKTRQAPVVDGKAGKMALAVALRLFDQANS